ncbi:MAG: hypothetical protein ACJAUH_002338, partial [Saprospiraceae bacterium]
MKHHIEKMIVDMYVSDKEKAQKLQSKVSQLFHKDLEQITENILSEFSTEDTTIHVNQLEIDLGDIRSDYFVSDFIKAYKNALRNSIRKLLVNKNAYSITQQETIQITTKSTEANILEILFFFLSFGRLPNNAPKGFNLNIAFLELLNKQKGLTIQRIQPLLKQRKIVHRIVYSFPEKTIELFLKRILPNQYKRIDTAIDNVNSIFN